MEIINKNIDNGKSFDWGRASSDYAKYRDIYPEEFYNKLAGLSLGIFIATVFKCSENLKTGIIISVTMLGCFLSGMMGVTMKYIVDKNIPILNRINPASMITDGFYTLYYYDNLDRYYFNLVSLGIFAIILISIAIGFLRRQKYDSI